MLDLKPIFSGDVKEIPFTAEYDLAEFSTDIVSGVCKVDGKCRGFADYAEFSAVFTLSYKAVCARCGEEYDGSYSFTVESPIALSLESEDDEDKFILIEDQKLDLDDVCGSNIILSMPTRFLCRDDCKGLCPGCGANLNNSVCSCGEKKVDPRMEKLKQYLNKQKNI